MQSKHKKIAFIVFQWFWYARCFQAITWKHEGMH